MELTKEQVIYRAEHAIRIFSCSHCALNAAVPIKITDCNLDEQYIDLQIEASDNTLNNSRVMHGGVIAWMADVAMAIAVSAFNGELHGSTIDMNINYIRPIAFGKTVICRAWNQCCGNFARRARVDFLVDDLLFVSAMGNYTGRKMTERMIKNPEGDTWLLSTGAAQTTLKGEAEFELLLGFYDSFGWATPALLKVPGRTELGGNHTDHQHGKVLAASIDKYITALACPRADSMVNIVSKGFGSFELSLGELQPKEEERFTTTALIRGIASCFAKEGALTGFNAYISSDIPAGKGLSSSAAFEVLIAKIFNEFGGFKKDAASLASIAQSAENNYYGKPCGLMDQMICANEGALEIDFKNTVPETKKLPFNPEAFGYKLLLIDSNASHADLNADYAAITEDLKKVCQFFGKEFLRELPEIDFKSQLYAATNAVGQRAAERALHVYAENRHVDTMAEALLNGNFNEYLKFVNKSGRSSEQLLKNIIPQDSSRTQLSDALKLVAEALDGQGAYRVHGGGFAGCVQAYVPIEKLASFKEKVESVLGKDCCIDLDF